MDENTPDLRTVKVEDLKGQDLSPAMMTRAKAPKPTWFVKRLGDGYIFPCEEREAWDIINNHSSWKRHDFQFVGYSDGKTYKKIIDTSMAGAAKLDPLMAEARIEIQKYRAAEEKLIIAEAVDMDGEPGDTENEANRQKVLRLRKIIDKLTTKLETLEAEHRSYTRDVVKRATDEEMKVAMKNWKRGKTWPSQVNIITPGVSGDGRSRILNAMPRA